MKTAIQWLQERYNNNINLKIEDFKEALEKEKEQIIDAMERTAMYVSAASLDKEIGKITFEDLYNQTYNKID
jgi:hypothetical protein